MCGVAPVLTVTGQEKNGPLTAEQVARLEQEAGTDPGKLLHLAGRVESQEARRLLHRVVRLLVDAKDLSTAERNRLARLFASRLEKAAPEDVTVVLGPSRSMVIRQVVYRRYLEQWLYETPLPLAVLVDYSRGQEPRVLAVHALPAENP